jgi:isopenicillin-N N-acyltransferase-like protein
MIELVLEGSPFERGFIHGRKFAERIRPQVQELWASAESGALSKTLEKSASYIGRFFPDINLEIEGIAAGAGVPFEQAFLFNNRSILAAQPDGCSNVAFVKDGSVVVGANKDVPNPDPGIYFVKRVLPSSGRSWLGYSHIGRLWGYGINDAGLCTAGTMAEPLQNRDPFPSIGLYLVSPIILAECGSVREAISLLLGLEAVSESGNIMLADSGGEVAVMEVSPDKRIVRKTENGRILSTNFYASGEIEHGSEEAFMSETTARYATIEMLLSAQEAPSVEGMKAILSSHAESGPVCRHDSIGYSTALSFIAMPSDMRLLICGGPPCKNEYTAYTLGR